MTSEMQKTVSLSEGKRMTRAVEQTADKECFALDVDLDVRVKRQLGEHVEGFRGENDEGGCGVDENGLDERRGEGVPICRVGCLDLGELESR